MGHGVVLAGQSAVAEQAAPVSTLTLIGLVLAAAAAVTGMIVFMTLYDRILRLRAGTRREVVADAVVFAVLVVAFRHVATHQAIVGRWAVVDATAASRA